MRVFAAMAAAAFLVAPAPEGHAVTLRIDTVTAGQTAKVNVSSSSAGIHSDASNGAATSQITISTPASISVDAAVNGVMIDAQNGTNVRVSFEQGGSARELGLRIAGSRIMLRRNVDGDLVPGARMSSSER